MRTALNDYKIAKRYILDNYKFILNNRIQFYLDFNWKVIDMKIWKSFFAAAACLMAFAACEPEQQNGGGTSGVAVTVVTDDVMNVSYAGDDASYCNEMSEDIVYDERIHTIPGRIIVRDTVKAVN